MRPLFRVRVSVDGSTSVNLAAAFGGIGRALAARLYRRYWAANAINTVGRWLYRMAVGWLTWELTESAGWLGIIAFADTFPTVILSLIAGAVADRAGYMRLIRVTHLLTAIFGALFAGLTLTGMITIELIVVLSVVMGSLDALSTPARMAAVHALVPRADLSAAIALGSTTFNAARILGPAIAGALILWMSSGMVLAVAAVMFFQFYLVLLTIRIDETGRDRKVSLELFSDILSAVRYAFRDPGIRYLMIVLGVTGLLVRPYIDLLPGFAAQVFGRGPEAFATLMSSIGVGATLGGLWLAQRGQTAGLTRLVTIHLAAMSGALILFTLTSHIWLGAAILAVCGFWMLSGSVACQTLLQNASDSAVRARVMSLFVVISWGLPAVGALAMGWLASFVGLQWAVGGGAALALSVWVWARRVSPGLAPGLEKGA
jgi:MFS family permease